MWSTDWIIPSDDGIPPSGDEIMWSTDWIIPSGDWMKWSGDWMEGSGDFLGVGCLISPPLHEREFSPTEFPIYGLGFPHIYIRLSICYHTYHTYIIIHIHISYIYTHIHIIIHTYISIYIHTIARCACVGCALAQNPTVCLRKWGENRLKGCYPTNYIPKYFRGL